MFLVSQSVVVMNLFIWELTLQEPKKLNYVSIDSKELQSDPKTLNSSGFFTCCKSCGVALHTFLIFAGIEFQTFNNRNQTFAALIQVLYKVRFHALFDATHKVSLFESKKAQFKST